MAAPLSRRVRAYLALRALPTARIESVLARLDQCRDGGPVARSLAAVHILVDLAEVLLVPQTVEPQLLRQGLVVLPEGITDQVIAWMKDSPDGEVSGSLTDGMMVIRRSRAMGAIMLQRAGYGERARVFVHRVEFGAWLDRHQWGASGVLDLLPRDGGGRDVVGPGSHWVVRQGRAPRAPAVTSNPSPADIAAELPTASSSESPLRVVLLLGPSGAGKSMAAAAVARELGSAERTLRVTGKQARDASDLADVVGTLAPTCVVLDDLPVGNIGPAMAMLDRLHQQVTAPLLLLITIMHEGPIEQAVLPGFRPERVDAILTFHAPTPADRVALLVFHGLDPELAASVADLPSMQGLTGAYLAELARRILRGADPARAVASLALHQQIAGHNLPPSGDERVAVQGY